MTNIKETIKDLEDIKNCINQNMIAQRGFSLFVPRHKETLSQAIKICQAVESAEGRLPDELEFVGDDLTWGDTDHNSNAVRYGRNEIIDIATPILAKARLRIEEKEKKYLEASYEVMAKAKELQAQEERIEELEKEASRIRLGMGDDYGDNPVAVIDTLKKELQSLKNKLTVGNIKGLCRIVKNEALNDIGFEDAFIAYQEHRMSKGRLCELIAQALIKDLGIEK